MKVLMTTFGRFHSFHLARELAKRNALDRIVTAYPRFKVKNELPKELIETFPFLRAPHLALINNGITLPLKIERELEYQDRKTLGQYSSRFFKDQDFYIGQSSTGLETARKAVRAGSKFICDRGSTHILIQDRLLRQEYERWNVPYHQIDTRVIDRELEEYELATAISVPSNFAADSFIAMGVDSKKVKTIAYGVDSSFFALDLGDSERHQNVILCVGNFSVRKGVFDLLMAFRNLQAKTMKLVFVGNRDDKAWHIASKLGLISELVEWVGPQSRERLLSYYQSATLMVLPSIEEGQALVVAEAMSTGCPVIVSTSTGASDFIFHGENGFLFEARDQEALSNLMNRLCTDRSLQSAIGSSARGTALNFGNWSAYGDSYFALLQQISADE